MRAVHQYIIQIYFLFMYIYSLFMECQLKVLLYLITANLCFKLTCYFRETIKETLKYMAFIK